MSSTSDATFCGHCGERLPPFGKDLGYCSACASRYRRVLRNDEPTFAKRLDSWRTAHCRWNDPLLAALLAFIFPGAGQVYNGHWIKAALVFVTSPFVIPWLIGIADAYFSARRVNERRSADASPSAAAA